MSTVLLRALASRSPNKPQPRFLLRRPGPRTMHHRIVALETQTQPLPDAFSFPPPTTYSLTTYTRTASRAELHSRVADATILITTVCKLDAETLAPEVTPHLRYVAVMATGTDPVDLDACRARRIRVTNAPAANLDTVSEHALSLYFAARRRTVLLDGVVRANGEWKKEGNLHKHLRFRDGKPPLTCGDEVMGIVGYGGLGKRIAHLGRALGMQVLVAARKSPTASASSSSSSSPLGHHALPAATPRSAAAADHDDNVDRVPFDELLRRATVLVLSLPRTPQTLNLISRPELEALSPYAVLVNIARGGIVDEAAVVQGLKDGLIAGYAADVFDNEPLGTAADSPLLDEEARRLNVTMSPHLAWFSQRTMRNLGQILKDTVEGYVGGREINVIV